MSKSTHTHKHTHIYIYIFTEAVLQRVELHPRRLEGLVCVYKYTDVIYCISISMSIRTHTHKHTHIYIYIFTAAVLQRVELHPRRLEGLVPRAAPRVSADCRCELGVLYRYLVAEQRPRRADAQHLDRGGGG